MAVKKTELYSSLWASCDELRGGMDASQYKNYVLTLLFMKYVSDKYAGDPHALLVVPEGGSFDDIAALKGDKEIGDKINKVIGKLAQENGLENLFGTAENDFNNEDKLGQGKEMVDRLSNLVGIFEGIDLRANRADGDELLDRYDIYQILMDYWAETLQDDVYVLVQDGWAAGKTLRELVAKKGEKLKETPDLTLGKKKYKADLIPPGLMVARYFADKQAHIDELQADLDGISQELESLIEEHSGEEGLLAEATTDGGKVTKGSLKELIINNEQLIIGMSEEDPELSIANSQLLIAKECRKLYDQEAAMKKAVKQATEALDKAVFGQYPKLSEAAVKTLVVEDKWHATLKGAIAAEIERVTQQLANRVKDLEERYAEPLPELVQTVEGLSSRVAEQLQKMGLEWNE